MPYSQPDFGDKERFLDACRKCVQSPSAKLPDSFGLFSSLWDVKLFALTYIVWDSIIINISSWFEPFVSDGYK